MFGSDLPVEGGESGQFSWRDGPLLSAMKNGDWVVLDEVVLLLSITFVKLQVYFHSYYNVFSFNTKSINNCLPNVLPVYIFN